MNALQNLWGREPAMIVSFVGALIALGVSFGLTLTEQQTGAILAVTALLLGLITRSQVFSPATVDEIHAGYSEDTDPGNG